MASNNISSFAGQFLKGGIRPHLFEVNGNIGPFADEKVPFLVKAAQLPASTLGLRNDFSVIMVIGVTAEHDYYIIEY